MTNYTTDILAWMDKWITHQTRLRNLLLTLTAMLVIKAERELLFDLSECMIDTGEDIIELVKMLREWA